MHIARKRVETLVTKNKKPRGHVNAHNIIENRFCWMDCCWNIAGKLQQQSKIFIRRAGEPSRGDQNRRRWNTFRLHKVYRKNFRRSLPEMLQHPHLGCLHTNLKLLNSFFEKKYLEDSERKDWSVNVCSHRYGFTATGQINYNSKCKIQVQYKF